MSARQVDELSRGFGAAVYRFGDYELDRRTLELRKSGRKVRLAPQPARLLRLLASRAGELIARDELRRELWGEETFVDFERNLNYSVNCVRDALGDTAQRPRYIETFPAGGIASSRRCTANGRSRNRRWRCCPSQT